MLAKVLVIITLVLGIIYFAILPRFKSTLPPAQQVNKTNPNIRWEVPTNSISQNDEQKLKQALVPVKVPSTILPDFYLSVTHVIIEGDWAILSGGERSKTPQPVQPTGTFEFLAQKSGTTWQITTPTDPNFCEVLLQAPDTLISKSYYSECNHSPAGQVEWDVPAGKLPPTIEKELQEVFATYTPKTNPDNTHLAVTSIQLSSISINFASAGMQIRDVNNKVIPMDGFEYLLYKDQGKWKITTGADPDFCKILKQLPEDMLDESRRNYYIGCFPKF